VLAAVIIGLTSWYLLRWNHRDRDGILRTALLATLVLVSVFLAYMIVDAMMDLMSMRDKLGIL
jgi:hypothetical protein